MIGVIDRLSRNRRKQREFRSIVRRVGFTEDSLKSARKRSADIYFLHKYAGWSYAKLGRFFGVSSTYMQIIVKRCDRRNRFTVCHPKGTCQ